MGGRNNGILFFFFRKKAHTIACRYWKHSLLIEFHPRIIHVENVQHRLCLMGASWAQWDEQPASPGSSPTPCPLLHVLPSLSPSTFPSVFTISIQKKKPKISLLLITYIITSVLFNANKAWMKMNHLKILILSLTENSKIDLQMCLSKDTSYYSWSLGCL